MMINNSRAYDPVAYKSGWEKAQKEFESYLQAQYKVKSREAIQKLKRGQTFIDSIEAA